MASEHESGLGNVTYSPGDIARSIGSVEDCHRLLVETDGLSLAALSSQTYLAQTASMHSIDASLHALEALESTLKNVASELLQRRAQLPPAVQSIHNATLPVARLPPEILSLVVNTLAEIWSPSLGKLGWIATSHVCVSWRHVVRSIAPLWAGEVGVFPSPASFDAMLWLAKNAPLTVKNPWNNDTNPHLPDHYLTALQLRQPYRIRTVNLTSLRGVDLVALASVLSSRVWPDLEVLAVNATEVGTADAVIESPKTPVYPSLRWVFLYDVYFPFHAPALLGLSVGNSIYRGTTVTCTEFLDTLELCINLETLELLDWAPQNIPDVLLRKVQVPHLWMLNMDMWNEDNDIPLKFLRHLELPKLSSLTVADYMQTDTFLLISSFLGWLSSYTPLPPCIQNVSRLSARTDDLRGREHSVRFDDTTCSAVDWVPNGTISAALTRLKASPDEKQGIQFNVGDGNDNDDAEDIEAPGDFIVNAIAGWLSSASQSTGVPALKSAYFYTDESDVDIDWKSILQTLPDIVVLYITVINGELMSALRSPGPDGALPLPRLSTIVCEFTSILVYDPDEDAEDAATREDTIECIRETLHARATHNLPVTRMIAGVAYGEREKDGHTEEADKCLAELVSRYV